MSSPTTMFYFGDSLTDSAGTIPGIGEFASNLYPVLGGTIAILDGLFFPGFSASIGLTVPADDFGAAGGITDAFTHPYYALALDPSYTVENYAVATATASGSRDIEDFATDQLAGFGLSPLQIAQIIGGVQLAGLGPFLDFGIDLQAQVQRFAMDTFGQDLSDTAAHLFIGSNDLGGVYQLLTTTPPAEISALVGGLAQIVAGAAGSLASMGVGTIYVSTPPAFDFFPAALAFDPITAGAVAAVDAQFRDALLNGIDALAGLGVPVQLVDTGAVSTAISEDASQIGIVASPLEMIQPGLNMNAGLFDNDQIGFWNPIHPGSAVHEAWGAYHAAVYDGAETMIGTDGNDRNFGSSGDDVILAMGGDDRIYAKIGDDIVLAGSGNDRLYLSLGDDIGLGGAGDDRLYGSVGNDILAGHAGDDRLYGSVGDDVLAVGLGDDRAYGGSGDDVFIFTSASLLGGGDNGTNRLYGGSGHDVLLLALDSDDAATYDATGDLADIGIASSWGIDEIHVYDSRAALRADLGTFTPHATEVDLWGVA